MPVSPDETTLSLYPWWAKSLSFGKLQINELIFFLWVPFGLFKKFLNPVFIFSRIPPQKALRGLVALAGWTALISLSGPQPWWDLNRSGRLILNIAIYASVYVWSANEPLEPLIASILGLAYGAVANLIMTFAYPFIILDTIRMAGQNTPGVAMAIGIHLAGWWYIQEKRKSYLILLFVCLAIFLWGCSISFSRIGWFIGLLGLPSLFLAAFSKKNKKRAFSLNIVLPKVFFIFVFLFAMTFVPKVQEIGQHFKNLFLQKMFVYGAEQESDKVRHAYLLASLEIVLANPLGVGYSGYLEAQKNISQKLQDILVEEEGNYDANPHAAFLWYLTAGGFLGGALSIYVFFVISKSLLQSLQKAFPPFGAQFAWLIILPFFLIGCTVTYIFNSFIMLIPAAIVAGWARQKNLQSLNKRNLVLA